MSFAFETKRELCAAQDAALSHKRAEAYGYLLFAKKFSKDSIIFSTENTHVANRFTELLAEVWQVITEKKPQSLANGRVRTCLRLQYRIRTNASGFY